MHPKLIKPRMWSRLGKGTVAPEWNWFFRGLKGVWNFSSLASSERNLIGSQTAEGQASWSQAGWEATKYGWGINASAGGDKWAVSETFGLTGLSQGTWLACVATTPAGATTGNDLLGAINGENASNQGHLFLDNSGPEVDNWNMTSRIQINSIIDERSLSGIDVGGNGNLALAAWSYNGVEERLWCNLKTQAFAKTGTLHSNTEFGLIIGSSSTVGGLRDEPILYAGVWDRALSLGELQQLYFDPFGPFRMADEAPVLAAATGPSVSDFKFGQRVAA